MEQEIPYRVGDTAGGLEGDAYAQEKCRLDLYYPEDAAEPFPTLVWFHAGGLRMGNKYVPGELRNKGWAIAGVGYRLVPNVDGRACIDDAAAAVAWVMANIEKFGGDPDRIVVGGSSAGGYLAALVGLDRSRLEAYGQDADRLIGIASLSGHAVVHEAIRTAEGIDRAVPTVDADAPIYHVRADAPPVLLTSGDRELELLGRYEEQAFFMRMLKVAGAEDVTLHELQGYGHTGELERAALPLLGGWLEGL